MKNEKLWKLIWKITYKFGFPIFAFLILIDAVLSFMLGEIGNAFLCLAAVAFFALIGFCAWITPLEEKVDGGETYDQS